MKKIGENFKYRGSKLVTVEQDGCDNCYFEDPVDCKDLRFKCSKYSRKDKKAVVFKLIPFKFGQK